MGSDVPDPKFQFLNSGSESGFKMSDPVYPDPNPDPSVSIAMRTGKIFDFVKLF